MNYFYVVRIRNQRKVCWVLYFVKLDSNDLGVDFFFYSFTGFSTVMTDLTCFDEFRSKWNVFGLCIVNHLLLQWWCQQIKRTTKSRIDLTKWAYKIIKMKFFRQSPFGGTVVVYYWLLTDLAVSKYISFEDFFHT